MNAPTINFARRTALEDYFFSDHVRVDRSHVDPVDLQGFDSVNDATVVALTGALQDATVVLDYDGEALSFDITGSIWQTMPARVSYVRDSEDEAPYLNIDVVAFAKSAPEGLAATMLWRMVRACMSLGIPRIELFAIGGRDCADKAPGGGRIGGYYAWPRLGFDGAVLSAEHVEKADDLSLHKKLPFFPDGLARGTLRSLHDLFETPGGKEFWLIGGGERPLTFTVAPMSRSVLRLNRYLTEKGLFK
ncbi:hypothetical protein WL94_23730 [Burkholderia cepacia]|uniref:hypothetical protein n=1 Tax=Burkholderia cepacia TaxID=292 RepID=UPI00076D5032|nr:hypothetical protein [Burkholderia cepacia]KWF83443.1 hypothetical protein WL94_23730 [Burkholderia cepacia]